MTAHIKVASYMNVHTYQQAHPQAQHTSFVLLPVNNNKMMSIL